MFHVKQSIKLIMLIFILCMCGVYPVKADSYTTTGVYTFSDSSDNTYQLTMPEQEFYNHVGSGVVSNTLAMGATQYTISQEIKYENSFNNSYLASTVITGTRQGWLDSYAQRFTYENSSSDRYRMFFTISEVRGGTGTVTILYKKNENWVQFGQYDFTGTYNGEFYVKEITGYRVEVRYTLNSRFAFARADDAYSDGYKLNDFSMTIESSKDYQQQALDNIQELQEESNGLLGNVIDGIANLPTLIGNVLRSLFVPTDFYGDLETAMNDILDALGVVGYPITLYTDTCYVVRDTTTTNLTVDVPAFYYKEHTIFPRYYRENIFYFENNLVFENVQKTTWMRNFFGIFNADIDTITIGQLVKTLMSVFMWFGIIAFIIRIYNKAFGLDVNEEMGDDYE